MLEMNDGKKAGARRMLSIEQVLELVPVGKSTLKRMIKDRIFPKAHYMSPKKKVWYEDEIESWQETLPVENVSKRGHRRDPGKECDDAG